MGSEVELVSDGDGLAVIGNSADVERFFLSAGLGKAPSRDLDLHRLWSFSGTGGAAAQIGADFAANSGRWVKLTAESAEAVKKYGLMPTKTRGVSHAMIGEPGDIKQWLQIAQAPSALLRGPFALTALSTMMQQRAMQQQMDEIVGYLQEINEKVDDILRGQKDAVLADMIGVELIIEEALTVRDQVGRVSEVTWSKVQATGMTIARTQAYALRQLDAIAENLEKKASLGEIAKATKEAEPRVREWLAVLAQTFQLQDGVSVLELDRVLDASPDELDSHRLGRLPRGRTASNSSAAAPHDSSPGWTRPSARRTRKCCSTRSTPQPRSSRATRSRPASSTSAVDSGSSPATKRRTPSAGARPQQRCATRCSRPHPRAPMQQSGSAPRPSTGQPRCSARSTSTAMAPRTSPERLPRPRRPERRSRAPQQGSLARSGRCSSARQQPPYLATTSRTNTERPGHIDSRHARARTASPAMRARATNAGSKPAHNTWFGVVITCIVRA